MPATILHGCRNNNKNTTKCHNKETFSSFLSREHFRNVLENFPFCQMQVECHTPVRTPFPLRHCASKTRRVAQRGASHTMYNQCFSCQHNDKTRTISLNCIIIKLNVAAVCILSPKFWQSDSWIRRRCNLRSKHKFLVWKRVLEVTACWNKIFSYLFYNQTDKNGACICKKWVKLSKFIYEVLKLALCANLNKWYWSHFVIFSFQPIFSPPWPEDSPEESESIVGKEKRKWKYCQMKQRKKVTFSCRRISLSSWSPSKRRPRWSRSSCFRLDELPSFISHSWIGLIKIHKRLFERQKSVFVL